MMAKKDDGGLVFPDHGEIRGADGSLHIFRQKGITLRDAIALASPEAMMAFAKAMPEGQSGQTLKSLAANCYAFADEMLIAREIKEEETDGKA